MNFTIFKINLITCMFTLCNKMVYLSVHRGMYTYPVPGGGTDHLVSEEGKTVGRLCVT